MQKAKELKDTETTADHLLLRLPLGGATANIPDRRKENGTVTPSSKFQDEDHCPRLNS